MTQTEQVMVTLEHLRGVATLGRLYCEMDFSTWGTKTPEASVRRILQQNEAFFKIKSGLWGLKEKQALYSSENWIAR